LRNGKTPEVDRIPPEVLKVNPYTTTELLYPVIKRIWTEERMPEEWKKGILIKIPKKGNLSECNNWRGITLLSISSKIMTIVILNRIREKIDQRLKKEQAGFRKNHSCVDLINTLGIIIEQSNEWNERLYLVFIDFEKAFDSVSRDKIWKIMERFGLPQKILKLVQETYGNCTCQIMHEGKLAEPIEITSGVQQGCVPSPIVFLLVIDEVSKKSIEGKKRGIIWRINEQLEDLVFADNVCLLSHRLSDMRKEIKDVEKIGKKVGLKINKTKTKAMRINTSKMEKIVINGKEVEDVNEYRYLGSIVMGAGGTDEDVNCRIKMANTTFVQLCRNWRNKNISLKTKLNIFISNVKAVILSLIVENIPLC
jgi:hypothetical protein